MHLAHCIHKMHSCPPPLRRLTGVDAMQKVMAAWAAAPLYPDIPEALRHLNNANIKVKHRMHA